MVAAMLTRALSSRERVQDTLSEHRNEIVALLSRYVAKGKNFLQPHHLLDGLAEVTGENIFATSSSIRWTSRSNRRER